MPAASDKEEKPCLAEGGEERKSSVQTRRGKKKRPVKEY